MEGLDSASLANAQKYVSRQRDVLITPQNQTFFFYNCHRMFTKKEINAIEDMQRRHRKGNYASNIKKQGKSHTSGLTKPNMEGIEKIQG